MIGRWSLYLLFTMLYFLLVGVREWKISVVGFIPKDDILRSEHVTKLSFPMLTNLFLGREFRGLRLF
jgi:hypothetical protein